MTWPTAFTNTQVYLCETVHIKCLFITLAVVSACFSLPYDRSSDHGKLITYKYIDIEIKPKHVMNISLLLSKIAQHQNIIIHVLFILHQIRKCNFIQVARECS